MEQYSTATQRSLGVFNHHLEDLHRETYTQSLPSRFPTLLLSTIKPSNSSTPNHHNNNQIYPQRLQNGYPPIMLLLTIFLLLNASVLAAPASTSTPDVGLDLQAFRGQILPPGYKYEALQVTGSIGLIVLNHTGTIEQILAQVVDEHPGFRVEDVDTTPNPAAGHDIMTRDKVNSEYQTTTKKNLKTTVQDIRKLTINASQENKSDLACYPIKNQPDWRAAEVRYIEDGVSYLKKVNALCSVNGHACSRISCSYKSAVTLCNVVSSPPVSFWCWCAAWSSTSGDEHCECLLLTCYFLDTESNGSLLHLQYVVLYDLADIVKLLNPFHWLW